MGEGPSVKGTTLHLLHLAAKDAVAPHSRHRPGLVCELSILVSTTIHFLSPSLADGAIATFSLSCGRAWGSKKGLRHSHTHKTQ